MGPSRAAVALVLLALSGCKGPPAALSATLPKRTVQEAAPYEAPVAHGRLDQLPISLPDLGPGEVPIRPFGTKGDGEVLEVEFDKIRVDLGRWHGVQPGQRFQVYRGEGSGLQIAAMLEVTRVEERTSWCRDLGPRRLVDGVHSRIVDVPGSKAPVEPGCGVRSPFFETHERQVFVLLGARPWGHSRERLAELLADSGVSVREQVGSDTDFVVILDGLSGSDLDELRLARRFGVTLITQRELLDYLP